MKILNLMRKDQKFHGGFVVHEETPFPMNKTQLINENFQIILQFVPFKTW